MGYWKKITDKSKLEGKIVYIKTGTNNPHSDLYESYWCDTNKRWEFVDRNSVTCREWHGEPTHYVLVNE